LTPESVKIGFEFATIVKRRDSTTLEILKQIEQFQPCGSINKTFNGLSLCVFEHFLPIFSPKPLGLYGETMSSF
ncbi:MAG: hypothetical protein ACREA5_05675, partial [Nitrosotalea sp.]